jgi:hypothetical protein
MIVDPAKWVSSGGAGGTGYISLTDAVNNQINGTIFIEDFDGGAPVYGFKATFKMRVGDGTANAADGWSFNWATNLGNNMGEEGSGAGLTVAFDTYQNTGEDAPEVDVKVGGLVVAHKHVNKSDLQSNTFADTLIQYVNGLLTVQFNGITFFQNIPIGLPAIPGGRWAFGAHTGGENETHWLDDLNIQTYALTVPMIAAAPANAHGITVALLDAPNAAVDSTSLSATVDAATVQGNATKTADRTVYTYTSPDFYPAGSTHDVVLTYKYGSPATTATSTFTVTVPPYTILPATAVLPSGSIDTTKRGFVWRIQQVQSDTTLANTLQRTEDQLSGLLGSNIADPNIVGVASAAASAPNPASAPIEFKIPGVINLSLAEGDNNGYFTPDLQMPGLASGAGDNAAAEILTGLEFPAAGTYTMIVNSDDGFRTAAGRNPREVTNPTLGEFNNGRGAADTVFYFYVPAAGIYGFRTVWFQGNGGANIEWSTVLSDGQRALINDTTTYTTAVKAYQLAGNAVPAFVRSVYPGVNATMINRPKTVEAVLVDGSTQVTASSVTLKLNGTAVTPNTTKTGGETKMVYTVIGDLQASTYYTAELGYTDNKGTTHITTWTFTTGPLSSTTFSIEAEDYDFNGGQANPQKGTAGMDVDVMPYYGGAYDSMLGVLNVDYYNNDQLDADVYRHEEVPNHTDMYTANNVAGGNGKGGNISINSSDRGSYQTTVNYGIGWSGSPDWYNYTRNFPDNKMGGWWKVYALLSYGGEADGQLSGSFGVVSDGVGTDTQTVNIAGTFSASGSGGWGANNLVPMKTASGADAVVKLIGKQTVRFNSGSGDYNALILSAAPPPPPALASVTSDSSKRNEVVIDWTLQDTDTKVNASTVKLSFNGQDYMSKATATKTDTGATIHLDLTGTMFASGELPWVLTFSDTSTPPQNVTATGKYVVNPYPTDGTFVIEAEDYNYDNGKTNPQSGTAGMDINVMPYSGGAYDSLLGIYNVDYSNNDGNDSDAYRHEDIPVPDTNPHHVDIAPSNGNRYSNDRGIFTTDNNWRIGWVDTADWCNYTRSFPKNDYNVWAALSYGDTAAGRLRGTLYMVTSDATQPNQTTQVMGTFNAPGSGGWGRNELVPMKDTSGSIVKVTMDGAKTVRFNMDSGDFDYLLFVPATAVVVNKPQFTKINLSGANITIEWTGGGTLISSDTVNGTYSPVSGNPASPATVPNSGKAKFFRVQN